MSVGEEVGIGPVHFENEHATCQPKTDAYGYGGNKAFAPQTYPELDDNDILHRAINYGIPRKPLVPIETMRKEVQVRVEKSNSHQCQCHKDVESNKQQQY